MRTEQDLRKADALVIPGGESTTLLRLLDLEQLWEPLREFGAQKPIFGTCAGAILLATDVTHPRQRSLGLVDITVERNGYGRQIDSSIALIPLANGNTLEAVFIRAPIVRRAGPSCKVLAEHRGTPVLLESGRHMIATFHPELSLGGEFPIHRQFLFRAETARKADPVHAEHESVATMTK